MNNTLRNKLILVPAAISSLLVVATYYASQRYTIDKYAAQPTVVGLPTGYDPRAAAPPYDGMHPSQRQHPQDPYDYPTPIGEAGPVAPTYADELQYPFACRTEMSGFGQPLVDNHDAAGTAVYAIDTAGRKTTEIVGYSKDCSLPTAVSYHYLDRDSGGFLPLDENRNDIEEVELDGEQVRFVVRLETGTINRHIYLIATLRGPHDTPARPDLRRWNRKLVYMLRGGVGIGRRQGRIEANYLLNRMTTQLAAGYAVAHSTANQTSTTYDMELAADTLARVKRQFVARYGEPRFTIGVGKSGGAIQQYLIGQNRPGLLDGGIALYSYPDMVTQTVRIMDCELLEYFFDITDGDNPKWRNWSQRRWVLGLNARADLPNVAERMRALQSLRLGRWPDIERGHTECTRSWRNLTPQIANPHYTYFASLFSPQVRQRVPWTYWDDLKRVFGTDEHGYARRTWDNVGVQYGLAALRSGQISIDEFLKLNSEIGGWKTSAQMAAERFWLYAGGRSDLADMSIWSHHNMTRTTTPGAPAPRSRGDLDAIAAAYRSGQVFLGALDMPIIDLRDYLDDQLDMHHALQSFSARLRMQHHQGHADNQLIWFVEPPGTRRTATPVADAFEVLERWLEARRQAAGTEADTRPVDADDRCYDRDGRIIARGPSAWDGVWNGKSDGACMRRMPIYSNSRIVAGDGYAGDLFKCHLQPVDDAISAGTYAPLDANEFRRRLQVIFPHGVCDYSRGDAGRPDDLLEK